MRVVSMILAAAVLAGSTTSADAKGAGANAKNQPSVRASDSVPGKNKLQKNHRKGPPSSAGCANSAGKSVNCAPTVSPQ